MMSMLLKIPPSDIAFFKAIVESYDNLLTLRTEDPERHYLRMYFARESEADIDALLDYMRRYFSIEILARE